MIITKIARKVTLACVLLCFFDPWQSIDAEGVLDTDAPPGGPVWWPVAPPKSVAPKLVAAIRFGGAKNGEPGASS